jgi:tellurite resistance protein TerC
MTDIAHTGTPLLYAGFSLVVVALLAVDFVLLRAQGSHKVSLKEAAWWSIVWFVVAPQRSVWRRDRGSKDT